LFVLFTFPQRCSFPSRFSHDQYFLWRNAPHKTSKKLSNSNAKFIKLERFRIIKHLFFPKYFFNMNNSPFLTKISIFEFRPKCGQILKCDFQTCVVILLYSNWTLLTKIWHPIFLQEFMTPFKLKGHISLWKNWPYQKNIQIMWMRFFWENCILIFCPHLAPTSGWN